MRRFYFILPVVTLIAVIGSLGGSVGEVSARPGQDAPSYRGANGGQEEYASDRLLVKLKAGETSTDLERINDENGAETEETIPRGRLNVVDLPSDLPVEEAVEVYEDAPEVEYAEPDFVLKPSATTANDTSFGKLYGLHNTGQTGGAADADIDAPEAWDTTTGSAGSLVAVIDEGADVSHPDLKNNLWTNPGETSGNGVDDDGNGKVDDVNGWDFVNEDKSLYDPDSTGAGDEHGTHVAGTIAAEGNNGAGITGVNWKAKVMVLKFLGPDGGYTSDAVEALDYAVKNGAKISNNSWGGGGKSQALLDAIKRADTAGHLFVAAAGNAGTNNDATPSYPASYDAPNIVAVAATDKNDALASFSNYGATSVDIAAPGVGILSTLPGNTYGSYSGTSMATPHVAGVAALVKSEDPDLDDAELKTALLDSVDKKSNLSSKVGTGGRLNAAGGLDLVSDDTTPPETTISSGPSGTVAATSASFAFSSSESGSAFECSLDGAAWADCDSPEEYPGLSDGEHEFEARATDAAGNVDPTPASRTWTVDATAPEATAPTQSFAVNSALGTSVVPIGLAWSGADEGGVSRYELQQSTNGGTYANVSLASAPATSVTRSLAPGSTYRFRVRAQDGAGNWSGWVEGTSFKATSHQETSVAVSYPRGSWTRSALSGAYGGYVRHANTVGATAKLSFTGRNVAWVAPKSSTRGRAEVWVDGVKETTVDLYSSTTLTRRVVFAKKWDSPGSHTVEIKVLGTSGRPRVDLDAFVALS